MKKTTFLISLLCFLSINAYSQLVGNSLIAEFSAAFSSRKINEQSVKETSFSEAMSMGYAWSDKWAVGINFQYSMVRNKSEDGFEFYGSFENTSTIKNYGLYARRFIHLSKRFYFAPRLDLSQENNDYKASSQSSNIYSNETRFINLQLSGSLLFEINRWLGIQTKMISMSGRTKYYDSDFSKDDRSKEREFNVSISPLYWEYGVFFIFGKPKV